MSPSLVDVLIGAPNDTLTPLNVVLNKEHNFNDYPIINKLISKKLKIFFFHQSRISNVCVDGSIFSLIVLALLFIYPDTHKSQ